MTFATREGSRTTASAGDSPIMNLPTGIQVGDLLIIVLGVRAASINTISGWTSFADSAATLTGQRSFWRKADGTEGSTVTGSFSVSGEWSAVLYRFSATADPDTTPPEGATAFLDSDDDTPDPPNLTPTGGAKDYTWIAAYFQRASFTTDSFPANYTNTGSVNSGGSANRTGFCDRQLNASSENPGTFTAAGDADWSATTIVIHPSGVATNIDTKEKRAAVLGVARPWMRDLFPIATPDEEWRLNVGNAYGGNALSPAAAAAGYTSQLSLMGMGS